MTDTESSGVDARPKTPIHLWIVGVVALLWNTVGPFDYLATQLELEFWMSKFTEEQLAYYYGIPAWAVSGWALGVWGAFVGSIGLLLRKKWSLWAFVVSFVGLVVSTIYSYGLSNGAEAMGTVGVFFNVAIWIVAIFLLVYAWRQTKSGVLS